MAELVPTQSVGTRRKGKGVRSPTPPILLWYNPPKWRLKCQKVIDVRSQIRRGGGVFQGLSQRIRLIVRLMGDPRVSPLLKVLPVGTLLYLIIPDLAPGPIDDAAIIWLGTYLFVELCPPDVVQEHMAAETRLCRANGGIQRGQKKKRSSMPSFGKKKIEYRAISLF